jgi:PAS domain S-box-containing protein
MATFSIDSLSQREAQLLRLASNGYTDKAVAKRLQVSIATVRTYWDRIREKMGTPNRAASIALYVKCALGNHEASPEDAVRESEFLEMALQNSVGGVVVLDGTARIMYASRYARELLGYEDGQIVGKKMTQFVPEREVRFQAALSAAITADGKPNHPQRCTWKDRDGKEMEVSATVSHVKREGLDQIFVYVSNWIKTSEGSSSRRSPSSSHRE